MIAAPFGSHFINLAAITAAICTGDEAHPDRDKRWVVGMLYGGYYLLLAIFAAPFVALFIAMPRETIAAITGVALIVPLSNALAGMMGETKDREAAILTFVATASGVTVFGIGSAFWGLMVGFITLAAARWLRR